MSRLSLMLNWAIEVLHAAILSVVFFLVLQAAALSFISEGI